jgi:hypothetical protein
MNGTAVPLDPPDPVQRSVQAGEGIYESLLLDQQGPLASVADPKPDPDLPDSHVFGPGSGSGSFRQRYGSGSFYHQAKIVRKTLIPNAL